MNLNEIYSAQSYREESIIEEKRENKDYAIKVSYMADDDNMVAMLVDGHHSFEAAKRDGVEPEIEIVKSEYKSLEDFYKGVNVLIEQLRISGYPAEANNLHELVHETAWTTGSELLNELAVKFKNIKKKYSGGLSNEIDECLYFVKNHRKILEL